MDTVVTDYQRLIKDYLDEIFHSQSLLASYQLELVSFDQKGNEYQIKYLVSNLTLNLTNHQRSLGDYFLALFQLLKKKYSIDDMSLNLQVMENKIEINVLFIQPGKLWVLGIVMNEVNLNPSYLAIVKKFSCGYEHFVYLDEKNQLFGGGYTGEGQLGIRSQTLFGGVEKIIGLTIIYVDFVPKDIVCQGYNTAILDQEGQIWIAGLFVDEILNKVPKGFIQLKMPIKIKKIACGYSHLMAVDENGDLWGLGFNDSYELGTQLDIEANEPQKINLPFKIKLLACGSHHTVVTDEEDNVWIFGDNSHGQLGIGKQYAYNLPTKLNLKAKFITCGPLNTMVIDLNGNLFAFGNNKDYQLGIENNEIVDLPIQIAEKIKFVACAKSHTLVINESDHLYGCGYNDGHQLGNSLGNSLEQSNEHVKYLTRLNFENHVIAIAGGDHFSLIMD